MVENDQKWSKMVKNGQKWPKMVKNSQKWSYIVIYRFLRFMVQTARLVVQTARSDAEPVRLKHQALNVCVRFD